MKKIYLIYVACLLIGMGACAASVQKQVKDNFDVRKEYNTGAILFEDKAPETLGPDVYHRIIPDAESHVREQARTVLVTLYNSPEGSIPAAHKIHYTPENTNGISAKGDGSGDATIFYSMHHIEKSFATNDTVKLFFEARGVLLREPTHTYQLELQGIGFYRTNHVSWTFIEGMADAIRVANGGFDGPNACPKDGNYMDGYRTAGYFFVRSRDNKDPEFLRRFNRSTLEAVLWSFDGAIKHTLGNGYSIDELWHEYQVAVGDIQA